jgi:hypothetical protein
MTRQKRGQYMHWGLREEGGRGEGRESISLVLRSMPETKSGQNVAEGLRFFLFMTKV